MATKSKQSSLSSYTSAKRRGKQPVRKNKKYKQVIVKGTDKEADRARAAKGVGWRISKSGRRYFENRSNRSDTEKERKYHGGVNRRAKPRKQVKQTSTRASRGLKTTRRVAPVRKYDRQKSRIVDKIIPATYTGYRRSEIQYFPPKSKRLLSGANLEARLIAEMRLIDLQDLEHCLGVDKYGNVLFRVIGTDKNAPVPNDEWWRDHIEDRVIIIHNHPIYGKGDYNWWGASSPLSGADVAVATGKPGCRGIIACANGMYFCCLITNRALNPVWTQVKGQITRRNRAAAKTINETFPWFEGQSPGETEEAYERRYREYRHKRSVAVAKQMSINQAKYLTAVRGYKYIKKRY